MTIEMTTTALGTNIARVRGANMDKISAATRRSVLGTWTPDTDNAPEYELAATEGEDLLDLVPTAPERPMRPGPASQPTDRQRQFLIKLAGERGVALDEEFWTYLTKAGASAKIDELLAMPKARPAAPAELEDGVYVLDGEVFMVKHAIHGSGRQYASKLMAAPEVGQAGEWVYQGAKPLAKLTAEMRLTREMAQAYGAVYGCCVRCGKALTDPESIARSVGSTCWGKF